MNYMRHVETQYYNGCFYSLFVWISEDLNKETFNIEFSMLIIQIFLVILT